MIHFAWLRCGVVTPFCGASASVGSLLVTWDDDDITCPRCRTRQLTAGTAVRVCRADFTHDGICPKPECTVHKLCSA